MDGPPKEFRTERDLTTLCVETLLPKWCHILIDTYFDNWPVEETQAQYKAQGKLPMQYMYEELYKIFTSTIHYDNQFKRLPHTPDYLMKKYPGDSVRIQDMDYTDRKNILAAFTTQLGMHSSIFSYKVEDFPGVKEMSDRE